MVNPINANTALAVFGQGQTLSDTSFGVDASLLTAWAAARAGIGTESQDVGADPNAPLAAVWTPGISPGDDALLDRALGGKAFFDPKAKLYADLGATGDYRRLFTLYSGLSTLQALARAAEGDKIDATRLGRLQAQFSRGLDELAAFFDAQKFEHLRVAQGDRVDEAKTVLSVPSRADDYVTGIIHRGSLAATVSGLPADASFDIVTTSAGGTERRVSIDLSEMGSIPRSLGAVVSFINGKLAAAGAASRLQTVDQTPKTTSIVLGGRTITNKYVGPRQYALKVDAAAGERVAFEAATAKPVFYAIGQTGAGSRLIKLEDVSGAAGQPAWLERPEATDDPIGAYVATGWLGPGAPYSTAPAGAYEQRTNALTSDGVNTFENLLREPGEAVLKLAFADGRSLSVSTAWRSDDLEGWRARSGENEDRAILDDLAERLTQLLHEQGVAAGVDVWEDGEERGLSLLTGDFVSVSSFAIGGKSATLEAVAPPNMVDSLREGVFARRFEAANVAASSDRFYDVQTFTITTAKSTQTISLDGGAGGITGTTLMLRLNEKLVEKGIVGSASLYDDGTNLNFRLDGLHDIVDVQANLNGVDRTVTLQAPASWADGGLPVASAGQPFADGVRVTNVVGGSPLLANAGAIDLEIVVATPAGEKTVTVSVDASERANDPDPAPDEWSSIFQDRLDAALNAAGVYVDARGADLSQWAVSEGFGQRLVSVSVNGVVLDLEGAAPAFGVGGAFAAERSFTSAQASTGVSDTVPAFAGGQSVSISFGTVWGDRTVTANLDGGDPQTLESAALRLNEALAAQGYDLGVEAVALSGGGAGLRIIAGNSHSIRAVTGVSLGGQANAVALDPIDSASRTDDPVGASRVADRAARGAAILETSAESSSFTAPTVNASGWFPGRAFDIVVGAGARVATARAVATGADGAVYVLADLDGDSSSTTVKGVRDVALIKYDSVGKLAFTQILGASQSASGFALAVSASGDVVVAGAVEGNLSNAGVATGGVDSFVALFGADGAEKWSVRRGARADDEVRAVSFAPDGSIIVAGRTEGALGTGVTQGGADAYVRGFSAAGLELFSNQFGTNGADSVGALLVRDDGAGGAEIFTGGVEDNRGVLRRFTYSASAGFAADATRDLGYFLDGAITSIAADGSSLYVGGSVGADRLTLSNVARSSVAQKEGFVARLDAGLSSAALDRVSYLGSAGDDAVNGIAVVNSEVYAVGVAGALFAGAGGPRSSFLARLDDSGAAAWVRTFNSAGGQFSVNALAVDASGASALDVLGLPRGAISASTGAPLVTRTSLRAGDEFRIGAEGGLLTTVKIGARDTLASVAGAINRAIGGAGRAEIVHEDGVDRLKISAGAGRAVRLDAGREGRDALAALGVSPGLVARNDGGRGAAHAFGLGLIASDLNLGSKAAIGRAKAELSAAVSIVRQAYEALLHPNAKPQTEEEKALEARRQQAGVAPQYYTAQLANYRAALARLTGGG